MEKTIKELKQDFMKAYRWCRRVQEACLFKPVDICVTCGFTKSNFQEDNINAWTINARIWDPDAEKIISASWIPWRPEDFENEKKVILAYLTGKGITVK